MVSLFLLIFVCVSPETPKDIAKSIGQRIQRIRAEQNITQFDLAVKCNLERTQIGRIERGEINTTIRMLKIIADVLGVKVNDLIGEN